MRAGESSQTSHRKLYRKKYSIINNKKSLKSRAKKSAEKAEKLTLEYLLSPTSIQSRQMHSV